MTDKNSITPPPELLDKWDNLPMSTQEIFVIAAQYGADQELEACCEWGNKNLPVSSVHYLRAARRPKPPSLKEQALAAQQRMWDGSSTHEDWQLIRRALEQLDD